MRDSLREEDSPRESIEIDKKPLYVYNAYNAYNDIQEKRINHCIRYKPSTHKAVKDYCGSDMTIGQFHEAAAVLFMDLNPKDRVIVNIEKVDCPRQMDIQGEMQEFVCIDDMKEFVNKLVTDDPNNVKLYQIRRRQFILLLKGCNKVKEWGTELSELVIKARGYFG